MNFSSSSRYFNLLRSPDLVLERRGELIAPLFFSTGKHRQMWFYPSLLKVNCLSLHSLTQTFRESGESHLKPEKHWKAGKIAASPSELLVLFHSGFFHLVPSGAQQLPLFLIALLESEHFPAGNFRHLHNISHLSSLGRQRLLALQKHSWRQQQPWPLNPLLQVAE